MIGSKQPPKKQEPEPFSDPFSVGQLVGMMVILTFIETNGGIPKDYLEQLKASCAEKVGAFMGQPTEDIYLMVDNLVGDIKKI